MKDTKKAQRPWGAWYVLEEGAGYKVKKIEVSPGCRLSLQKHGKRSEFWVVIAGEAEVTCDGKVSVVKTNESISIPLGAEHRLANKGSKQLVVIEVQTGSYLGEDDITRLEDDYGRH